MAKRKANDEYIIYKAVAKYITLKYPHIQFRFDGAGLNLSMAQRMQNKAIQKSRAYPDFFLAKVNGISGGLYLEIKTSRDEVYNKDGSMKKKLIKVKNKQGIVIESYDHNQDQLAMLKKLTDAGYSAHYAFGLDECIRLIDDYLMIDAL